ncbi:MAG: TlpA disulfide reductase family protein [Kofleriaceae bacterium]
MKRIGLALGGPRSALALAGRQEYAGRSGSDLLAAIALFIVATQLRFVVSAVWLGVQVKPGLGFHAIVHILTQQLVLELALLVVGAMIVYAGSGARRELGRSFDLACVAIIPVVAVHLVTQVIFAISNQPMLAVVRNATDIVAIVWAVAVIALAVDFVRNERADVVTVAMPAKRAGWIASTIAIAGIAVQILWIAQHPDSLRPIELGGPAPAFALPAIGAGGALGEKVSRRDGRVTVVDFWATWCGPCLRSMPHLNEVARKHPEIDVLTINLDDPEKARKLFDDAGYKLALLADDGEVSERYGVVTIPHTVVIDGNGQLRLVDTDLEAAIRDAE